VTGTIAGISLLVGGIGLRKAIGASDAEIFAQFLLEAVLLSLAGGVLGAAAGVGITKAAAGFFTAGLPIQLGGLAMALGIAVLLGVLYGTYPALKAARMMPIDALRSAG